jgi:hypothetical protein
MISCCVLLAGTTSQLFRCHAHESMHALQRLLRLQDTQTGAGLPRYDVHESCFAVSAYDRETESYLIPVAHAGEGPPCSVVPSAPLSIARYIIQYSAVHLLVVLAPHT